jgi:hypothetical protein
MKEPRVNVDHIIGATTDTGKLPETNLDRFAIVTLVPYDAEQGALIALEVCDRIFPSTMKMISRTTPTPSPRAPHATPASWA